MRLATQNADTRRWVAGAHTVYIPAPAWASRTAPSVRARGGNWGSAQQGSQVNIAFTRSGGYTDADEIPWEDAMELPWPVVEETRSRQRYEMGKSIDGAIYSAMRTGLASGSKTKFGTDTNNIARTAPYAAATDTARGYPKAILKAFNLKMKRAGAFDQGSDAVGRVYAVMAPEVFNVLTDDMEQGSYGWDLLTADLLRNNSVLANATFEGRLYGVDVFSWNGVSVPTGTNDWIINCGARAAMAADVRAPLVQYFPPSQNQKSSAPAYLFQQAGDYAYAELSEALLHEYSIDGGS